MWPSGWVSPGSGALPAFRAKRLVDALVDLPFALPTAVAGHRPHQSLYRARLIGPMLVRVGIRVAFTPSASSSRSCLSVCRSLCAASASARRRGPQMEEVAASLGAKPLADIQAAVVFPLLRPGPAPPVFAIGLPAALGEYGW